MVTAPHTRPIRTGRWFVLLALITIHCSLITGLAGCGYTTAELYPAQYRNVAVPLFENRTFYRGVEADLGEALTKEIELRTPYRLATGEGAETELTGTIQRIEQRRLSRTADAGLPQEVEVSVVIDFVWRDRQTSAVIAERRGLEQVGRFVPSGGSVGVGTFGGVAGEPFEVAQHAAVARLADDIVSAMRGDF